MYRELEKLFVLVDDKIADLPCSCLWGCCFVMCYFSLWAVWL